VETSLDPLDEPWGQRNNQAEEKAADQGGHTDPIGDETACQCQDHEQGEDRADVPFRVDGAQHPAENGPND